MPPRCQSLAAIPSCYFKMAKQPFMKTLNGNLDVLNLPREAALLPGGEKWVTSQHPCQDV